jgi:hypothetical protein
MNALRTRRRGVPSSSPGRDLLELVSFSIMSFDNVQRSSVCPFVLSLLFVVVNDAGTACLPLDCQHLALPHSQPDLPLLDVAFLVLHQLSN